MLQFLLGEAPKSDLSAPRVACASPRPRTIDLARGGGAPRIPRSLGLEPHRASPSFYIWSSGFVTQPLTTHRVYRGRGWVPRGESVGDTMDPRKGGGWARSCTKPRGGGPGPVGGWRVALREERRRSGLVHTRADHARGPTRECRAPGLLPRRADCPPCLRGLGPRGLPAAQRRVLSGSVQANWTRRGGQVFRRGARAERTYLAKKKGGKKAVQANWTPRPEKPPGGLAGVADFPSPPVLARPPRRDGQGADTVHVRAPPPVQADPPMTTHP